MALALLPLAAAVLAPAHPKLARAPGAPRAGRLVPERARAHAAELRDFGYTVLSDACVDPELLRQARQECDGELSELLACVGQTGLDPMEQMYSFNEVCHRYRHRWDFRVKGSNSWKRLIDTAVANASPIIEELHRLDVNPDDGGLVAARSILPTKPTTIMSGAIVSKPGALPQKFHPDASKTHMKLSSVLPPHRLFNVFVPLVDIAPDSDGTQFLPGTHLTRYRKEGFTEAIARSEELERDAITMKTAVAPACPAGGIILFDYRVLHRGLANNGARDRPLAYAVCSTGGAWDRVNFPDLSIRDVVARLPQDEDELETIRRVVAENAPYWDEIEFHYSP